MTLEVYMFWPYKKPPFLAVFKFYFGFLTFFLSQPDDAPVQAGLQI